MIKTIAERAVAGLEVLWPADSEDLPWVHELIDSICDDLRSAGYENGRVMFTIEFDGEPCATISVEHGRNTVYFRRWRGALDRTALRVHRGWPNVRAEITRRPEPHPVAFYQSLARETMRKFDRNLSVV